MSRTISWIGVTGQNAPSPTSFFGNGDAPISFLQIHPSIPNFYTMNSSARASQMKKCILLFKKNKSFVRKYFTDIFRD
ncbi:hypothetical protein BURPS668_A2883 [Burkholderia pseudomallei 668]|nr:hypothetical protein BURPS668_A2883 [Burkholderia pseudomallei 668]